MIGDCARARCSLTEEQHRLRDTAALARADLAELTKYVRVTVTVTEPVMKDDNPAQPAMNAEANLSPKKW